MPKKKTQSSPPEELSKEEIVRAVTNDPALSTEQFELGGKTYPIVDLHYDDYLVFVSMLQPLIEQFAQGAACKSGISLNGVDIKASGISPSSIIQFCSDSLPQMVKIACKSGDPNITIEQIKEDAKNPFKLADIVLLQVLHNNIIRDFASFFRSVLPLMRQITM